MTRSQVIGVIGLGSMGRRYVDYFDQRTDVRVVGCDPCVERFPTGVSCRETFVELLDEPHFDVVVIASPAEYHLSARYSVAERYPSCSILMEKPVSNRRLQQSDFRRCQSLMDRTIAVGYCWRFHPYARQLYEERSSIHNLTLYVSSDMRLWPGKTYADPLREFSHELDLVTYLTAKPCVTDAIFTPTGFYQIDGTHRRGRWTVRIAPFHSSVDRWVEVQTIDGQALRYYWDVDAVTIQSMYREQASQLVHATGPDDLLCPLRSGLQTTVMVDAIDVRLDMKEALCPVM